MLQSFCKAILQRGSVHLGRKYEGAYQEAGEPGASFELVPIPKIDKHEVLIKVKAASICGTDVHIYNWDEWAKSRVKPPYVFGHEFSGEVVLVGKM